MRRSTIIVLIALFAGVALFAGSYLITQQLCTKHLVGSADDLTWLRQEFHLSDGELASVRELHQGYLPKCAEMCTKIAAKKREIEATLTTNNLNEAREPLGRELDELAVLRAKCQFQMLQHFSDVSHAMPPEQGRRYLAEMQRLTLGFHEQIEQSMSDSADHAHGHH
jgi:hypothetical protein